MDVNAINAFVDNNLWLMLALTLWTLPWKGVALWKAVKREDKWWFIAMLILNTVAILEIIYIFFIAKRPKKIAPTF
jgi:hypothetical protein